MTDDRTRSYLFWGLSLLLISTLAFAGIQLSGKRTAEDKLDSALTELSEARLQRIAMIELLGKIDEVLASQGEATVGRDAAVRSAVTALADYTACLARLPRPASKKAVDRCKQGIVIAPTSGSAGPSSSPSEPPSGNPPASPPPPQPSPQPSPSPSPPCRVFNPILNRCEL